MIIEISKKKHLVILSEGKRVAPRPSGTTLEEGMYEEDFAI